MMFKPKMKPSENELVRELFKAETDFQYNDKNGYPEATLSTSRPNSFTV